MVNKKKSPFERLGTGELELLEMLWRDGPVNLSEAHEALGQPIGYTTVQTRLNRLVEKGVVKKSKERPAKYLAAITREQVNQHDLNLLVKRVNEGKFLPLVAQLVSDRDLSRGEIDQLKALIAEAEAKEKKTKKAPKKAPKKQGGRS